MELSASESARSIGRSWSNEVREVKGMLEMCARAVGPELKPTMPDISTMTTILSTNGTFDLDGLRSMAASLPAPEQPKKRKRLAGLDEVLVNATDVARKKFKNQVSLRYTAPHPSAADKALRRNVMLFGKGTIHVTGSRSVMDAILSADIVLGAIADAGGRKYVEPEALVVTEAKHAMINSDFNVGVPLRLQALREACERYNAETKYDPDTHPGVIARFRNVTVIAFSTGRCIVTGSKSLRKMVEGYSFILGVIYDNRNTVVMEGAPPEATASKRPPRNSDKSFVDVAQDPELECPKKRPNLVRK